MTAGPDRLLFRLRGGINDGWGHLIRCAKIANHITASGWQPKIRFAAEGDAGLWRKLKELSFGFNMLPDWDSPESSEEELSLVASFKPDIVVIDRLDVPRSLIDIYRRAGVRVAAFDDMTTIDTPVDLAISPQTLTSISPDVALRRLVGPQFFVIDQSITNAAKSPDDCPSKASRLLICSGGCMHQETCGLLLEVVRCLEPSKWGITMMLGFDHSIDADVIDALRGLSVTLLDRVEDMSLLFRDADLAFSSSGFLKWELAASGTPAILFSIVDHQDTLGSEFADRTGSAEFIGRLGVVEPEAFAQALSDLANSRQKRVSMIENGRELIDGHGLDRLVLAVHELSTR